ncbi:hypothetical protein [Ponticaulis sp.]|uniref:hypothetical protein n=1 Tax=Ponticaulis sp. TaxID=2020902 RepID=UPI000B6EB6EC|nr:hypothetical protein [Ponticaulis sp.]MAJ09860.1 hypothetical protein [Ponticaulis sp.]RPG18473.1 MAG: hypothetical protein CBC85_001790 [Hyphomonadaceae bacterium TMED125]|tara:strand:+ start:1190 stop:1651 length:462 start_codon:yes stop_codon:yes gene_type:complete
MKRQSFRLPPQDYILSLQNLTRLALLYNGLKETKELQGNAFGRRSFADWLNDQLISIDGNVFDFDGDLIWDNLSELDNVSGSEHFYCCVDDAFNDDASFRWVSTFSNYAVTPPKRNRLHLIQNRMELITAAFIISGLYQPQIEGWENPFTDEG